MNVNRSTAIMACIGIALAVSVTDAVAAFPKPGATCQKLNLTSTYQNKKFTCIKLGKKLVWNKGIALVDPAKLAAEAKAAADAKAEQDRIAAEQAKKEAEQKALADAKVAAEAKIAAEAKAASDKIAIENATFDIDHLYSRLVYERSRNEIANAINSGSVGNIKPIYHIGQGVDSSLLSDAYIDMDDAIRLWSKYFQPEDVEIIYYSSSDKDWAANKFTSLTSYSSANSTIPSCSPSYCGNGMAVSNFKLQPIRYVFEHGLQKEGRSVWHKSTVVHEYTHLAQAFFTNQNNQKMPNWILEGFAQFYGEATSFAKFDFDKKVRAGLHSQYWFSASSSFFQKEFGVSDLPTLLRQQNPANSVKIMERLEYKIPTPDESGLGYLFGGYAAEVLVSVYGHEKLVQYMQTFHDSEDFKGNFQKIYGMSTTDFYKKLTPYFAAMADEVKLPS